MNLAACPVANSHFMYVSFAASEKFPVTQKMCFRRHVSTLVTVIIVSET